jgi:endo-1,4-beta-D-glucanase Y
MPSAPRVGAAALAVGLALAVPGCGSDDTPSSTPASSDTSQSAIPMTSPDAFLSTYVTSDGRVLRHDQGNDIVSEGQAYGMLAAELAGRDDVARTIWSWTREHLQSPDRLLSYHADSDGHVLDHQAAADADTLMAYALLRYDGPEADALQSDGRDIASAVLAQETVQDSRGRPVLVAGPWATADPVVVDPSYWMPSVFAGLAAMTGEPRWHDLVTSSVDLVDRVTDHGQHLPPDWARLEGDRLVPSGPGGGSGTPQYGADAQRVPLWFAYGCDPDAEHLATAWWSLLQQDDRSSASALSLDGAVVDANGSTVALMAAGAAARAAGDDAGAGDLEAGALQNEEGQPSYYGSAWLVLGEGLRTGQLAPCG